MEYAVNAQSDRLLAGRYRMGQLLGSGGFGAVYLATDERLHRPVAIKICSTRRLAPEEAEEAANLFQREALTLARLRHPGLTAIWDYFNIEHEWYLVMEYVPGETLRDRLRRTPGPLAIHESIDYASQTCQVLCYLHSQNPPIVFRDLKPGNIMITPDGRVKLIDFGIARLFSPDKSKDTVQFGTPGYAPPEQYGGQTEPRSDVYGLGVVLHQMLTGHNPASSPFRLPPARILNPAVPEALEQVIADATAYNIDQRIPSAEEFCRLLERASMTPAMTQPLPQTGAIQTYRPSVERTSRPLPTGSTWPPQPRALPERPADESFGRSLLVGLLVVLMLGLVAAGGYVIQEQINAATRPEPLPSASPEPGSAAAAEPSPVADVPPSLLVFTAQTPDGGRNLYSAHVSLDRDALGRDKLAVGDVRKITDFGEGVEAVLPAISPDGDKIAFTKVYTPEGSTEQRSEVWLMNVDGSNQRQLLTDFAFARAPAWRPDGEWIAAEVAEEGSFMRSHDVAIVKLEANATPRVLLGGEDWEGGPAWSSDGAEIIYHQKGADDPCWQLFKIDVLSDERQRLIDLSQYDCGRDSGDMWADWAPDGKIAFARRNLAERGSDGEPTGEPTDRVAVLDPSQPSDQQLTVYNNNDLQGNNYPSDYPRWSRSGQYLIFEEDHGDNNTGLSYMKPDEPNENDLVPVTPLDLQEDHIRYADWW